jgi:hypothetical protein
MVSPARIVMGLGVLILIIGLIVALLGQVHYSGLSLSYYVLGHYVATRTTGLAIFVVGVIVALIGYALPKK